MEIFCPLEREQDRSCSTICGRPNTCSIKIRLEKLSLKRTLAGWYVSIFTLSKQDELFLKKYFCCYICRQRTTPLRPWHGTHLPFTLIATMEVVPGSLRPGDRWRLNAEATMHPFGVDFENKCQKPCRRDLFYKKKSSHTTHTRQSIYYYLSFCLVNSISLPFFFFHPILLKNLGGNFSTITENVVILTLTYELSNC